MAESVPRHFTLANVLMGERLAEAAQGSQQILLGFTSASESAAEGSSQ